MTDARAHPSKRRVLEALSRADLTALVDAYGLDADKRSKTSILAALDASSGVTLPDVLGPISDASGSPQDEL